MPNRLHARKLLPRQGKGNLPSASELASAKAKGFDFLLRLVAISKGLASHICLTDGGPWKPHWAADLF
jgi:hypothetical protein